AIRLVFPDQSVDLDGGGAVQGWELDKLEDMLSLLDARGVGAVGGVHPGRIVYERYPRMRAADRHLMFSVTKAFVGMAVALLEDRGEVRLDRAIAEYVPELKGAAWEPTPVRDVLEMSSGIETGETASDPYSDPQNK